MNVEEEEDQKKKKKQLDSITINNTNVHYSVNIK